MYRYQGEPARLAGIQVDENGFYHIWFERLLNYQLPIKTTLHGESEVIEIEDTEFVGHEVNALYDPVEHVFMIQRNRDSLGPTAIGELLNSLVVDAQAADNASLSLILDREARGRGFRQSAYRKVQLKVTGLSANNLLARLWNDNRGDIGVDNIEIIISSNRTKEAEIDSDVSKELLEEYIDNPDTQKLKIHGRNEDESPIEPIDLINQKLEAYSDFDYNETRNFNPISVYERMLGLYVNENGGVRNRIQRVR